MFSHVATFDDGIPHMQGITDLEVVTVDDTVMLYTGSEADGGLSAFTLTAGGAAVYTDQIGAAENRGTYGLSDLDSVTVDGQTILVPAGRHDDRLGFHVLGPEGELGTVEILGGDTEYLGNLEDVLVLQVGDKTYMVASQWGGSGFMSFEIRNDLTVGYKNTFEDTETAHIGAVSDLVGIEAYGRTYFFAASTLEDGVTSYWMGQWGNIKERDSEDASTGLYLSEPTVMETVVVDGIAFLIVGGSGSSSLSVMKVNVWGGLFQKDHVLDDRDSRFDGVTALEVFSVGDRSFLLAGGADDGLTLFEVAPGGYLIELASIADDVGMTLSNVSDIEVVVFGNEVQVFVSSASEPGVTQLTLDLGDLGAMITGWMEADTLTGTAADDILMGYDGDDVISGGDGDDIIMDGAGADLLTGGAGADRFVFSDEARLDRVTDFTPGEDVIDLSSYDMLYGVDQLTFVQKDYGVLIEFGEERIALETEGGQLLVGDLSADDFLF